MLFRSECGKCDSRFIADIDKLVHLCWATGKRVDIRFGADRSSGTLSRQRPLYPSALFRLLEFNSDEASDIATSNSLVIYNAFASLSPSLKTLLPNHSTSDTQFWGATPLPPSILAAMALDELLENRTAPLELDGDGYPWDKGAKSLDDFFERVKTASRAALWTGSCASCGVFQVAPTSKGKQHRCGGASKTTNLTPNKLASVFDFNVDWRRRILLTAIVDSDTMLTKLKLPKGLATLEAIVKWKGR